MGTPMDSNSTILEQATFSATAYVLIGLVGIPANFLVLSLAIFNRKQQNGYWILIANLTFADAVLLIQMTTLQAANAKLQLYQTSPSCIAASFLVGMSGVVGLLSLPQISLNRYTAFYFADRYDRLYCVRNCTMAVALTWMVPFVLFLPLIDYAMVEEVLVCGFEPNAGPMSIYFILITYCPAFGGYALVIWSSTKVWIKLRKLTQLVGGAGAALANNSNAVGHAKQLLKLLVVFALLPLFLQIPIMVAKIVIVAFSFEVNAWLLRTLVILFYLNAAVNPFITISCVKPYKTSVRRGLGVLSRCLYKRHRAVVAPTGNAGGVFFMASNFRGAGRTQENAC